MKTILVTLFSLFCIINAIQENSSGWFNRCEYVSPNGGLYYTFAGLGQDGWLNTTDVNGNVWFFQLCNIDGYSASSPCPTDSSVCVSNAKTSDTNNMGSSSTVKFSDSPYGSNGFEIMYGNVDDDSIKTVIDVVCSYDQQVITIQTDESFTTITVNSTYGCANEIDWDEDDVDSEVVVDVTGFFFFVMIAVAGLLCTVCCCCCLIRRRRCQRNKNIAMKQFSNVAFQPIPSARGVQQATQQPLPAYNPYLVQQTQPQFVYYYPNTNNSTTATHHNVVPLQTFHTTPTQVNDDEKLAKQLQAQFDQESRV